jgi:hypothetical protein
VVLREPRVGMPSTGSVQGQAPLECRQPVAAWSEQEQIGMLLRQHRTAAIGARCAGHLAGGGGGVLATALLGLLPGAGAARGVVADGAATLNTDVTGGLRGALPPPLESTAEPPPVGGGGRGRPAEPAPLLAPPALAPVGGRCSPA